MQATSSSEFHSKTKIFSKKVYLPLHFPFHSIILFPFQVYFLLPLLDFFFLPLFLSCLVPFLSCFFIFSWASPCTQIPLPPLFPALIFIPSCNLVLFSSSLQFMVWAQFLCSSRLTWPPPLEQKALSTWPHTDPWSEHAQSRHPTATHLSLCTPASTHTLSNSCCNSTTRAGWRGSSRAHTLARWEETSVDTRMSHTNKQTIVLIQMSVIGLMRMILWRLYVDCAWISSFKIFIIFTYLLNIWLDIEIIWFVIISCIQIPIKERISKYKTCKDCKTSTLYKPTSKSIEKARLTQIPSEDMDLEEVGSGSGSGSGPGSVCGSEPGSVCDDGHRRRQSTASTDSVYGTESTTSSRESLIEPSHSLSQVLILTHCGILEELYRELSIGMYCFYLKEYLLNALMLFWVL